MKEKLKSNVPQIKAICEYLINECEHDSHLAERVMSDGKTVDNMYKYIMTAVKNKYKDQIKNGGVMVKDEDVYNLAIHYFIEEDETLKAEYPNAVTKEEVEANTEPVEEKPKPKKEVKPDKVEVEQLSLFDFGVDA